MGKIAIEFQNISKQYALGSIGTGTLSRDLNRWWARIRGKYKPQNKMFHFCKTFCSKITLVNTIQNVILNPI